MTRLLEKALEAARELTAEEQDEIARVIFDAIGGADSPPYILSPDERAAIERSREQADQGVFASDEEIEALWKKYT